jgi:hypothetical protein
MGKIPLATSARKLEKFILNTKYYQNSGQGRQSAASFVNRQNAQKFLKFK